MQVNVLLDERRSAAMWRRLQVFVAAAILLAVVGIGRQLIAPDFGFGETVRGTARVVIEVDPGGAADRGGIAVGDVIVADPGIVTVVSSRPGSLARPRGATKVEHRSVRWRASACSSATTARKIPWASRSRDLDRRRRKLATKLPDALRPRDHKPGKMPLCGSSSRPKKRSRSAGVPCSSEARRSATCAWRERRRSTPALMATTSRRSPAARSAR